MVDIKLFRRPFISELLNTLVTEKFGNRTNDDDFSGPSDASEAPGNFLINFGGSNYVISPEVDSSSPVEPTPVSGDNDLDDNQQRYDGQQGSIQVLGWLGTHS